jgi:hypothetical protein
MIHCFTYIWIALIVKWNQDEAQVGVEGAIAIEKGDPPVKHPIIVIDSRSGSLPPNSRGIHKVRHRIHTSNRISSKLVNASFRYLPSDE